jgi:hypothetical protein
MGADFVALIPSESTKMGYGYVHTIREKLMCMVDAEVGERYIEARKKFHESSDNVSEYTKTYADMLITIKSKIASATTEEEKDMLYGVYLFIDHSDCDGEFENGECDCVLKALRKLHETDDDIVVERLIKVFDNAVSGNGYVTIW